MVNAIKNVYIKLYFLNFIIFSLLNLLWIKKIAMQLTLYKTRTVTQSQDKDLSNREIFSYQELFLSVCLQ